MEGRRTRRDHHIGARREHVIGQYVLADAISEQPAGQAHRRGGRIQQLNPFPTRFLAGRIIDDLRNEQMIGSLGLDEGRHSG